MGEYPAWICRDCGSEYGRMPEGHYATWHYGKCGWCGLDPVLVTEPRDYRYPKAPDPAQ